jgi:hypothetical protein
MLVYQAARQIRLWTGAEPPLSVMWGVVSGDSPPAVAHGTATGPAKSSSFESSSFEPIDGTREPD